MMASNHDSQDQNSNSDNYENGQCLELFSDQQLLITTGQLLLQPTVQ